MAANITTHALSLLLISTAIFAGLFSNGLFANILSSQANDDAFLEPFTVMQTMKFSNTSTYIQTLDQVWTLTNALFVVYILTPEV